MARIRLRQSRDFSIGIRSRSTGKDMSLPGLRLLAGLYFTQPGDINPWPIEEWRSFEAIVDTGAPFSILPARRWRHFEDEIRWIELQSPGMKLSVAGTTSTFRMGRVHLSVIDAEGRWMPPAWTLACCLEPESTLRTPVLGLHSNFLMNNRRLQHRQVSNIESEWWLEDPLS